MVDVVTRIMRMPSAGCITIKNPPIMARKSTVAESGSDRMIRLKMVHKIKKNAHNMILPFL